MPSQHDRAIRDHQTWLGYLQPDGLVVSPAALVDAGILYDHNIRPEHLRFRDHLEERQDTVREDDGSESPRITDLSGFLTEFLGWRESDLIPAAKLPDSLSVVLPEYRETLTPDYAVPIPDDKDSYLLLIGEIAEADQNLDKSVAEHSKGWDASPSRRFERLLRETGVEIGLIANGRQVRLLHAPAGENPGSLTFTVPYMAENSGRPMLGGLLLLLEEYRLFTAPEKETLPALLNKSRAFQANVSTALAAQVLDGLYELLRGLRDADTRTGGKLLRDVLDENPEQIYEGLLNVLMRLVFLLFAEDRDLMPDSTLYGEGYSIHGLFEKLREDHERNPDTMDTRYGAWARLLALFRLVHAGSRHADLKMPARYGYLFDPERFPFLEGRSPATSTIKNQHSSILTPLPERESATLKVAEPPTTYRTPHSELQTPDSGLRIPLIPDGTIYGVLSKLVILAGERLSYRTLDVEQIGSVYETVMGFKLEVATGTDIKPLEKRRRLVGVLDGVSAANVARRVSRRAEPANQCLIFLRDVRSELLYTQMKGRGCRTVDPNDLANVTPDTEIHDSCN